MPDLEGALEKKVRLVYLVARVYHALRATRLEPALKSAGVTPLQYTIMTVVAAHEGLSSAELSRRFYVTPQTMGQVLGNLEQQGLLRRKEDPENRRVLRVSLTAKGERLVEQCESSIEQIEHEIFGSAETAEKAQLRKRLSDVTAYLRNNPSYPAAEPASRRRSRG